MRDPLPPRQIPSPPTWREAMESMYQNQRVAGSRAAGLLEQKRHAEAECERWGLSLARKHDPEVAGLRYIARSTPPESDTQKAAARALRRADNDYQQAVGEQRHWEESWRWYQDELDAHPELADQPVKRWGKAG
jgi:hypothetical protein